MLNKLSEVEKLKLENADLTKRLEQYKRDNKLLRWKLMSQEEQEAIRLCYRMFVKEDPTMDEWEDFKVDFVTFRTKKTFEIDKIKEMEENPAFF